MLRLPFVCPVSGVSFRQEIVTRVCSGQRLVVAHDPDNPHDANACVVRTLDGTLLGFLPKALSRRLRAERPDEHVWDAEVDEVLVGATYGLRIRVSQASGTGKAGSDANSGDVDASSARDDTAPIVVRSKSGRPLGTLAGRGDGTVVVLGKGGQEVEFPEALVLVG